MKKDECERVLNILLLQEIIAEKVHATPYNFVMYLIVGPNAKLLKNSSRKVLIDFEVVQKVVKSSEKKENSEKLSGLALHRWEILDALRTKLSEQCGVRPHDVMNKGELDSVAKKAPETVFELENYLSKGKVEKYGKEILDTLREDRTSQLLLSPSGKWDKKNETPRLLKEEREEKDDETDEDLMLGGDFDDEKVDPDQDLVDFAFELDDVKLEKKKSEETKKRDRKDSSHETISLVDSSSSEDNDTNGSVAAENPNEEEALIINKKHKSKLRVISDDDDL